MSEPFIGEVRIFAGNYAPRNWAFCNGQLLSISQYAALFSLLGPTYGGDGINTFGLPNLKGRLPIHPGRGPGLTPYVRGQTGGLEKVGLNVQEIPSHSHTLMGVQDSADDDTNPEGKCLAKAWKPSRRGPKDVSIYGNDMSQPLTMSESAVQNAGSNSPHENRQPYLVMNFIIALVGLYPSRP